MPLPVQIGLLVGSLLAFVLLAYTLRARQTWPAVLLWVAPVCLMLPLTDWVMAAMGSVFPSFTMDGQPGDGVRFTAVAFVVLCAVELSTQLFMARVSGVGSVYRTATDVPVRPPPLDPAATDASAPVAESAAIDPS